MENYEKKLEIAGNTINQLKANERNLKKKIVKYETKYGRIWPIVMFINLFGLGQEFIYLLKEKGNEKRKTKRKKKNLKT